MPRTCFCNDLDSCSRCRTYETHPAYAAWALLPRERKVRCRHRGAQTRRLDGRTSADGVGPLVFACARHGECTAGAAAPGLACCAVCPDHEPPDPFEGKPIVRNLLYHLYPRAGTDWRWHVGELRRRIGLFNGRRVVAVVTDRRTESPQDVEAAFGGEVDEVIAAANEPRLREVRTFEPLFSRVQSRSPGQVTFYAHGKGVTYDRGHPCYEPVRAWVRTLYETCLDYWPLVERTLRSYPLAGPFLRTGDNFDAATRACGPYSWMYFGSFWWFRNRDLFARPDWRDIEPIWYGIEPYNQLHYRIDEAGCLFHRCDTYSSGQHNLYDLAYWHRVILPDLERWRAEHAADRREG